MPWLAWLLGGLALLGLEMFLIEAEFYLVFIGASGIVVGLLGAAGVDMPPWVQWLVFASVAIFTLLAFRQRVYAVVKGRVGHVRDRIITGDRVVVPVQLEPGQTCRVEYQGTTWSARNVDVRPIAAGTEAVISDSDGLLLHLKAVPA
jgi:membrane protein implicated in regulation of membrane protease activity